MRSFLAGIFWCLSDYRRVGTMEPNAQSLRLLIEERKFRTAEMLEYNKRLDRVVLLYITSVFAAIGLRATGQLNIELIGTNPSFAPIALAFFFLNLCILTHGISQAAWNMALAKFVHTQIDPEIEKLLRTIGANPPKSASYWDDWPTPFRTIAIAGMNGVTGAWIILVLGLSFLSLSFVNMNGFVIAHLYVTIFAAVGLVAFLAFVVYLAITMLFAVRLYHKETNLGLREKVIALVITVSLTAAGLILAIVIIER